MSFVLGLDTSNYTTSCALFDSVTGTVKSVKKLLPVKSGEKGLRQSDAVFHHTKQLPELMKELMNEHADVCAVGYSYAPRCVAGSYMPCFLVGENVAKSVSYVKNIDCYKTSHQTGHILAALYSCNKLDMLKSDKPFLAFHVSGGTTDLLLCTPCKATVLDIKQIGTSLDLKAGQAVDRAGVMMNLPFPCGQQLEKLALESNNDYKIKPVIKDLNCCLSGVENKCKKMLDDGESCNDVAKFCLTYIQETICEMTKAAISVYGNLPVVFAGGVMSDMIIRHKLEKSFDCCFAQPNFSCDNAAGVAVYAAIMKGLI